MPDVRDTVTPWLVALTVLLLVLAAGLQSNLLGCLGVAALAGAWAAGRA